MDVLTRTLPSLIVIVGALLVLRHWVNRGQRGNDAGVRVLTRAGISKGAVVAVVAVGGRQLLVGASEHGVNLITELDTGTSDAGQQTDAPPDADTEATLASLGLTSAATTDPVAAPETPRPGLRSGALSSLLPTSADRPRMAPIDRLRAMTVRRPVPSHPRSNGVQRHT